MQSLVCGIIPMRKERNYHLHRPYERTVTYGGQQQGGHLHLPQMRPDSPQAGQLYGRSPVCRTRCFTSFLCMLKDFPHSSQVNTLSAVCVFLCSFKLLKLLNPRQTTAGVRLADRTCSSGPANKGSKRSLSSTSAARVTQVWLLSRVNDDVALDITRGCKPARKYKDNTDNWGYAEETGCSTCFQQLDVACFRCKSTSISLFQAK